MKIKTKTNHNCFSRPNRHQILGKRINVLLGIIIAGLGLYYVFGVNDLSVKGYVLFSAKSKLAELREEHKRLDWQVASLRSTQKIAERAALIGLVEAEKVNYLGVPGSLAAKNEP